MYRKLLSYSLLKDYLLILAGSVILAAGYSLFCLPSDIVPGGVYGMSIAIRHLTKGGFDAFPDGLPIGVVALAFNIPLFVLALSYLGRESAIKTIFTFVSVALLSDFFDSAFLGKGLVQGETVLSSFYGGALLGLGVYLIFLGGGTCAGTDTLARVISRKRNIKLSTIIIVLDSLVVLVGLLAFGDWRVPLYSWITIFVYGKVVEVLQPQNPHKAVFVISNHPEEIREALVGRMGVRGTFLDGRGMYTGAQRQVLFIIIQRKNLPLLKKEVLSIDPKAFITSSDATNDTTPALI